ncbi:MAG: amidohydrolase [Marinifilaceae bacterium]
MKIALIQYAIKWENVTENLTHLNMLMQTMEPCDVVVLPEMFTSGFTMESRATIAPYYSETCAWMLDKAKQLDAMIMGTVICEQDNKFYNRMVCAMPNGECEYYDKRHGFTYGGEPKYFEGGERQVSFEFRGMRFAPFICYDLRFPVWSRNTVNYDIAVYVANWPVARIDVWNILLAARAIENQCFTIGVNCIGHDGNGMEFSGECAVFNSRGKKIGGCEPYKEQIGYVTVKPAELRNFRRKFPVLEDRDSFTIEMERKKEHNNQ